MLKFKLDDITGNGGFFTRDVTNLLNKPFPKNSLSSHYIMATTKDIDYSPNLHEFPISSGETHITKRVYIGGLNREVDLIDLKARFRPFGTVLDVQLARDGLSGQCRGFGHITIQTTLGQWKKCMSLYNGAKWKGSQLVIEDAKPDYKERIIQDHKDIQRLPGEQPQSLKRRRPDVFYAKNMSLVTDHNVDNRKGWKRGRYGRAIAVMKSRRLNGTMLTFDPSHYKNNLLKLFNLGVKMKEVKQLGAFYEDYDKEDGRIHSKDRIYSAQDDTTGAIHENDITPKIMSNQQRLNAIKLREGERLAQKRKVEQALSLVENKAQSTTHIKFNLSDDENHNNNQNDLEATNLNSTDIPMSTEKHFEVKANLKPLFTPGATVETFKFFGDVNESEEELEAWKNATTLFLEPKPLVETTKFSQQIPPSNSTVPLFFFHFEDSTLHKRSLYKNERNFMRTSTIRDITKTWEHIRQELTQEFKRKHKAASRKKAKLIRDSARGSIRKVDL